VRTVRIRAADSRRVADGTVRAMTRPLFADAFGHHVWATQRLIDACLALSPEQLQASAPGTYGTIIETIRHLVGGDVSYLSLLTDGRVTSIEEDSMDLDELRAAIAANGPEWISLLEQDLDPEADVIRHRDDGIESHAPMGIRLAQVLHHGSDHRSQVCTILTTLGIEPPAIDVWDFAENDGRLAEVITTS
jgi:uncharacterized damage-inducible protein DinB